LGEFEYLGTQNTECRVTQSRLIMSNEWYFTKKSFFFNKKE